MQIRGRDGHRRPGRIATQLPQVALELGFETESAHARLQRRLVGHDVQNVVGRDELPHYGAARPELASFDRPGQSFDRPGHTRRHSENPDEAETYET